MLIREGPEVRVHTVVAGTLGLDGGAMFGVVPKPLWSRRTSADERNRIPLAMRCLLVERGERRTLIDCGLGNKEDAKFREIYDVRNEGRPTRLEDELGALGVEPGSIDVVVATHLHFDHFGGATRRNAGGEIVPSFPNARHVIRRGEYDYAHWENERIRASYLPENYEPLVETGMVDFVDSDVEVAPGIHVLRTPGHTHHHQSVLVEVGEERICFLADLVPTSAHLPLPWIMGYDVEPLVTLESKRRVLARAAREGWLLVFEHDPRVACGRAVPPQEGRGGCGLAELRYDADLGLDPETGEPA